MKFKLQFRILTLICLLGMPLHSITAKAGNEGKGGGTIVCRDDQQKIVSAELLDLHFAKKKIEYAGSPEVYNCGLGYSLFESSASVEDQAERAVSRIEGLRTDGKQIVRDFVKKAIDSYSVVDYVAQPHDTGTPRACVDWAGSKPECRLEFVAVTEKDKLSVRKDVLEFWQRTGDNTNLAALFFHESLNALKMTYLEKHGDTLFSGPRLCTNQALSSYRSSGLDSLFSRFCQNIDTTRSIQVIVAKLFSTTPIAIPQPVAPYTAGYSTLWTDRQLYFTYPKADPYVSFFVSAELAAGSSARCQALQIVGGRHDWGGWHWRALRSSSAIPLNGKPAEFRWDGGGYRKYWDKYVSTYNRNPIKDDRRCRPSGHERFAMSVTNSSYCKLGIEDTCLVELKTYDNELRLLGSEVLKVEISKDDPKSFDSCNAPDSDLNFHAYRFVQLVYGSDPYIHEPGECP